MVGVYVQQAVVPQGMTCKRRKRGGEREESGDRSLRADARLDGREKPMRRTAACVRKGTPPCLPLGLTSAWPDVTLVKSTAADRRGERQRRHLSASVVEGLPDP